MAVSEQRRVQTLLAQGLLDTPPEERFDRITSMAAAHFEVPIACVSLIDPERQWFKSHHGLDVSSTPRDWAFCDHTIRGDRDSIMVVPDATLDPRFRDNPLVTDEPNIRFYAGANLTADDGSNLGALCIIGDKPRPDLTEAERQHLRVLADLVMDQIELSRVRRELDDRALLLDLAETLSRTGNWSLNVDSGAIYWSPQVYAIHGVTPETFNPALGDALDFYVPEDRERVAALIREGSERGEGWSFDATLVRADGSRRLVRSLAECQRDPSGRVTGFFGVFQDLTDEREATERALEQERRYRILADNLSDVIAVYDGQGVFSYLSPSIEALTGYSPEELIGRTPQFFIFPEDHIKIRESFRESRLKGTPLSVEYRVRTKDGRVRWLEARPRLHTDENNELIEIHDCVRDVTDRHEREEALARAQADAEQAAQAKAAFLANMSHEIRTPLHGVIGFAEVLANTTLDDDQRRYVERIRSAGRGLSALIDDILDVSKIDAGKMTIQRRPFDLRALCAEAMDLTRSANKDRLDFAVRWDDTLDPRIVGDEHRVRQVIMNLVGNAAKFTREGSVQLVVARRDDILEIRVVDTGVGIAPDALERLFEDFTQADASVSRSFGGTGLGLTISRSLARLMGGDVRLESRLGEGTTAIVTLPHEPAAGMPQANADAEAAPVERARPLRILAVDDVAVNLELLGIMLSGGGHEVVTAGSGQQAIDILTRSQRFDVVLMDVQMPGMDGMEATRRIRESIGPKPPIVALTANVLPDQIAACREAGMDGHLAKPIQAPALARVLKAYGPTPARPAPLAPAADPLAELKARYRQQLTQNAADLRRFARLTPEERLEPARRLAHSIAGTSGSLGFTDVSGAAFTLEAAAREEADLSDAIQGLLDAISRATGEQQG